MNFRLDGWHMISAGAALVVMIQTTLGNPPAQDLLSGPKVSDEAAKEPPRRPGERMAQAGAGETPLRDWLAVLRELDLSDEQRQAMRKIGEEMMQARRNFMMSRSESESKTLEELPRLREQGGVPDAKTRETLQRLETQRPRVEEFQRKMWAILTPPQQEQFKTRLAELRQRHAEIRDQKRQQRRAGEQPIDEMMMQPKPQRMPEGTTPGQPEVQPQAQPSPTDRQRVGEGPRRRPPGQLDDTAQRRLKFLRNRLSAQARQSAQHQDGRPSQRDRQFMFDESESSESREPAPPDPDQTDD